MTSFNALNFFEIRVWPACDRLSGDERRTPGVDACRALLSPGAQLARASRFVARLSRVPVTRTGALRGDGNEGQHARSCAQSLPTGPIRPILLVTKSVQRRLRQVVERNRNAFLGIDRKEHAPDAAEFFGKIRVVTVRIDYVRVPKEDVRGLWVDSTPDIITLIRKRVAKCTLLDGRPMIESDLLNERHLLVGEPHYVLSLVFHTAPSAPGRPDACRGGVQTRAACGCRDLAMCHHGSSTRAALRRSQSSSSLIETNFSRPRLIHRSSGPMCSSKKSRLHPIASAASEGVTARRSEFAVWLAPRLIRAIRTGDKSGELSLFRSHSSGVWAPE
jgi:hypothetical protein